MAKAKVVEIQVGGIECVGSLEEACEEFERQAREFDMRRTKICFVIQLPNGVTKQITIRDEDGETFAYGNLGELPSMMDYAREVVNEKVTVTIDDELFLLALKREVAEQRRDEYIDARIDLHVAWLCQLDTV